MEKWDVYDENCNFKGYTKTREDVFDKSEYHLSVSSWIINKNKELLIQKRAACKRIHPNKWGITGGSVSAGETSRQGCVRETFEEIGLLIEEKDLIFLSRTLWENTIFDDYVIIKEFLIENAVIQKKEVDEIKWASIDEIKQLFRSGLFMMDDLSYVDKVIHYMDEHI